MRFSLLLSLCRCIRPLSLGPKDKKNKVWQDPRPGRSFEPLFLPSIRASMLNLQGLPELFLDNHPVEDPGRVLPPPSGRTQTRRRGGRQSSGRRSLGSSSRGPGERNTVGGVDSLLRAGSLVLLVLEVHEVVGPDHDADGGAVHQAWEESLSKHSAHSRRSVTFTLALFFGHTHVK